MVSDELKSKVKITEFIAVIGFWSAMDVCLNVGMQRYNIALFWGVVYIISFLSVKAKVTDIHRMIESENFINLGQKTKGRFDD